MIDHKHWQSLEYDKRFGHLAGAGKYSIAHGATHGSSVTLAKHEQNHAARIMESREYGPRGLKATYPTAYDNYANYEPDDSDTSDEETTEDIFCASPTNRT